jgi:Na+-translocating ferredoxin:NAD+ oxidoreductase subunit D
MEYFDKVKVTSSPHVRSSESTKSIMMDVIIALLPTTVVGVYFFGLYALFIILVCMVSCVLFEFLTQKALKRQVTITDMSAALTGLLLALNLPASVPIWIPIVGAFFAIVIVKQLFGGLGQNFMNPALGARAFLVASWPGIMVTFVNPYSQFNTSISAPDAISSATPLALVKSGQAPASLFDMMTGNIAGTIGEVAAIALILGGVYLLIRKVITWHIPVSFIGTVALFVLIFGTESLGGMAVVYHTFGGGLLLGSIYMATDYSSCPITKKGQILFGVGCGLLTAIFRLFGASAEGVSFAILIMNLIVPLIDKALKPRLFGEVKA